MITVEELIEILKTKDPKLPCLVDGYESGMKYLEKEKIVCVRFIERDAKSVGWWNGNLEEVDERVFQHPEEYYPEAYSEAMGSKSGIVFQR